MPSKITDLFILVVSDGFVVGCCCFWPGRVPSSWMEPRAASYLLKMLRSGGSPYQWAWLDLLSKGRVAKEKSIQSDRMVIRPRQFTFKMDR